MSPNRKFGTSVPASHNMDHVQEKHGDAGTQGATETISSPNTLGDTLGAHAGAALTA